MAKKYHWTGRKKEKGQSFHAMVKVLKVKNLNNGIPTVIEINGEQYVARPKLNH